jgi:hypothetical protein
MGGLPLKACYGLSGTFCGFRTKSHFPDCFLGQIQPLTENAPCWIRTSDRLLRRLAVVGCKSLFKTGFLGWTFARCEQKCEQFAE